MEIRFRHWLIALLLATAIHVSFALTFERPARPQLADPGIEILLGRDGDSESGATELRPVGTEDLLEAEVASTDEEAAETIETEHTASDTSEAQSIGEIVSALDAETVVTPESAAPEIHTVSPEVPDVVARTQPKLKPKLKPKPAKPTKKNNKPKSKSKSKSSKWAKAKTSSRRGTGSSQARKVGGAGRGGGGANGGKAATSNYMGRLAAWLNKHKRYPRRARKLGQQGTTKVRFTIDRKGRLLSSRIVKSSGHDLLDREVRAMLRRATPMPAMPGKMVQTKLTVTVPISFSLR